MPSAAQPMAGQKRVLRRPKCHAFGWATRLAKNSAVAAKASALHHGPDHHEAGRVGGAAGGDGDAADDRHPEERGADAHHEARPARTRPATRAPAAPAGKLRGIGRCERRRGPHRAQNREGSRQRAHRLHPLRSAEPAPRPRAARVVGKAERGPAATEAIKDAKSAYLMAVGGAAYLVARAIKGSKVVGFEDLGMEAIYEFEVQDFPVTVAVDSEGHNVHQLAPLVWKEKIAREKLLA